MCVADSGSRAGGRAPMTLPSVYSFLDHREFLSVWFQAKKRMNPAYSYTMFAKAAGCSKSSLANVLGGQRRPRAATLDAFARAIELDPRERNYLGLLVELDGARGPGDRERLVSRILSARTGLGRKLESEPTGASGRYLERWYLPAIQELAGLPGFRDDAEWVASTLHPPIEVEEAARALQTLFELGFLSRDAEGRVVKEAVRLSSDPETNDVAVARFHREQIPALMANIDTGNAIEQHLLTATLVIRSSQMPEIKSRLNALIAQLANIADDPSSQGPARVVQLGVQLLPVSAQID